MDRRQKYFAAPRYRGTRHIPLSGVTAKGLRDRRFSPGGNNQENFKALALVVKLTECDKLIEDMIGMSEKSDKLSQKQKLQKLTQMLIDGKHWRLEKRQKRLWMKVN